jgi:hypothetical protein
MSDLPYEAGYPAITFQGDDDFIVAERMILLSSVVLSFILSP